MLETFLERTQFESGEIAARNQLDVCEVFGGLGTMPGAIVDAGLSDFETVLKAAEVQGPGLLLVLFLGDRIASVGKSWCPDCVRAEPVIYKLVNESETPVTLVRVYVGDRPTWRTPDHPLRCDERFKLKGVPTLIRWENGAITGRLEDYEADKEMKIKKLMASA